jgi:glyoxylase-like metal-dependent hydrolase (beta-lactamase superfamily II)
MILVKALTFNPFQENTYLLTDTDTRETALIDPGAYTVAEQLTLKKYISDNQLLVKEIWLTHAHIDHVLGLRWAIEEYKISFLHTEEDAATLRSVPAYASTAFGIPNFSLPDQEGIYIQPNSKLHVGRFEFTVLPTPGHAPGHLSFYNKEAGVIAGDALFKGSIGRTDLPGGDFNLLAHSIKTQLYTLPDDTVVNPGHGPSTTIGVEKKFNPYVRF